MEGFKNSEAGEKINVRENAERSVASMFEEIERRAMEKVVANPHFSNLTERFYFYS